MVRIVVVNARSAMLTGASGSHGGVGGVKRLTIRAGYVNRPVGRSVEISVADTGPGIPADILPHIFDPIFSTKRSMATEKGDSETTGRGGTGLGLTICRQLVEAAQGRIWVVSQPGNGAAFFLEIPAIS